jgi:hypothetical protein
MPIQMALPQLRPGLATSMHVPIVSDALISSAIEQAQLALAAKRLKMNADAALEVAQQNLNRIANLSPGIGGKLDVSR